MKRKISAKKLLLSPFTFLLFLVLPLAVVALRRAGQTEHTLDILLVNNGLLLCYLCARFILLLRRRPAPLRYDADLPPRRRFVEVPVPFPLLRERLEREGYRFDAAGRYAEKREIGFDGSLLAHAALILLLCFGMYDNLRQLDGTVLLGVGEPIKLYEKKAYGVLTEGLLASVRETGMQLQIRKQQLPSIEWPAGATDALLFSSENKELQQGVIAPGRPMRQDGFVINMNRLVYDAWVVVTTSKNLIVYSNFVKLLPVKGGAKAYSHYGEFADPSLDVSGKVWLDPSRKAIRVETTRAGKKIVDTELLLWGGNRKEQGGYVAKFEGLGQWSELHVTRHRHKWALAAGGAIALVGFLLRLLFRPKRVWIEKVENGTLLMKSGGQPLAPSP